MSAHSHARWQGPGTVSVGEDHSSFLLAGGPQISDPEDAIVRMRHSHLGRFLKCQDGVVDLLIRVVEGWFSVRVVCWLGMRGREGETKLNLAFKTYFPKISKTHIFTF